MKTLLIQKDIKDTDFKSYLEYAVARKAELICFGELATTGCLYQPQVGPDIEPLLALFSKFNLQVMIGFPHQVEKSLYNTYMYYYKGKSQYYRKRNLFPGMDEPKTYVAGTKPGLFLTSLGQVGTAICYDLRFPEVFSDLKEARVPFIFLPAAWPRVRIHDWKRLIVERARETNATIVAINAVGDDGTNVFGGSSMVVAADGNILAQADEMTPTILEVEL